LLAEEYPVNLWLDVLIPSTRKECRKYRNRCS